MSKLLIFDISKILSDSLSLSSTINIVNKNGVRIGGVIDVLKTIYHTYNRYGYNSDIVAVIDNGNSCIDEEIKSYYPEYKKFNSYSNDSRNMNPDSDSESRKIFLEQLRILEEVFTALGIYYDKCSREIGIRTIVKTSNNIEKIIVSDDDNMRYLLSEDCLIYRPFEKVLVDKESYEKCMDCSIDNMILKRNILGDSNTISCCKGVGKSNIDDFMRLVVVLNKNFDNEEEMISKCNEVGIKPRKTYMNFNISVYNKNVKINSIEDNFYIEYSNIGSKIDKESFSEIISEYVDDVDDILNNDINYRLLWGR